MACAALKRPHNFDLLAGPNAKQIGTSSSKRRRCGPITSTVSPSRIACPFAEVTPKVNLDELISEVQDEGRRIRRRRKLCPTSPSHQPTDAAMQALPSSNSWSSPLTAGSFSRDLLQVQCSGGFSPPRSVSPGSLSPTRSREPTFTVKQVVSLCERLWKEREEKLREEYNQVLSDRLAEQYNSFLKFTQDQVMRRYGDNECSYVS